MVQQQRSEIMHTDISIYFKCSVTCIPTNEKCDIHYQNMRTSMQTTQYTTYYMYVYTIEKG